MALNRRTLLKSSLGASVAFSTPAARALAEPTSEGIAAERDEALWSRIAEFYDVKPDLVNAENGNWGLMARPVMEAYFDHTHRVNRDNSYFARREYYREYRTIIEALAERLSISPNGLALTRGASEALHSLIGGYNRLEPGQAVMMADLDYGSMQAAMRGLARREHCEIIELSIPEPVSHDGIIEFYRQAFRDHPQTKFLLVTHISHRTGLLLPVREITQMAKAHGIDVVVDAAHSWGQIDFTLEELGADFVGLNLHKWIGAPIGVGALYIHPDRLRDIDPHLLASEGEFDRIEGRVHTGTRDFAAVLSIPNALTFHDNIGGPLKEQRLRYLRQIWVNLCENIPNLTVLTPDDPRLHAGITSFRISGRTGVEDNQAIAAHLLNEHNIFSVHRSGVAQGACVRITPALYNSAADMQAVANALRETAQVFAMGETE